MPLTKQQLYELNTEVQLGQRISALVNDEIIQKHLNGLLHGYQNMWLDELDPSVRNQLWLEAHALTTLIESLRSVINSGIMAAQQLELNQNAQ